MKNSMLPIGVIAFLLIAGTGFLTETLLRKAQADQVQPRAVAVHYDAAEKVFRVEDGTPMVQRSMEERYQILRNIQRHPAQ